MRTDEMVCMRGELTVVNYIYIFYTILYILYIYTHL